MGRPDIESISKASKSVDELGLLVEKNARSDEVKEARERASGLIGTAGVAVESYGGYTPTQRRVHEDLVEKLWQRIAELS